MISIRPAQLEALTTAAEASFILRAVEHLRGYDPARATTAGEEGLRQAASLALAKAQQHGYVGENSVLLVLELMSAFGSGFESDPQFRWFNRIFAQIDGASEIERTHRLRWHSIAYLDRVYGENGELGQDVPTRLAGSDMDALRRAVTEHAANPAKFLRWLHPQKHDFAGETACREIFLRAVPEAKAQGMDSPEGTFLTAALMFLCGCGIFSDPLFARLRAPFERRSSADSTSPPDPAQKVSRVLSHVSAYLERMRVRSTPPSALT